MFDSVVLGLLPRLVLALVVVGVKVLLVWMMNVNCLPTQFGLNVPGSWQAGGLVVKTDQE